MKTIKQHFEELPEPYRTQALENMAASDDERDSLKKALYSGFVWAETPQGHDYWSDVAKKFKDK